MYPLLWQKPTRGLKEANETVKPIRVTYQRDWKYVEEYSGWALHSEAEAGSRGWQLRSAWMALHLLWLKLSSGLNS